MNVLERYRAKLKKPKTYEKEKISLDLSKTLGGFDDNEPQYCKVRPFPGDPYYAEFCNFQGDKIRETLKPIINEVKEENYFLELVKAPENKWIKDLNFKIIFQYHVRSIKMAKQYKFANGQHLKRGEKGGTLDHQALNSMPENAKIQFKNSIEKGNIFCYISDFVVSLPIEYITYL